jgi:protein-disulfide isomerase
MTRAKKARQRRQQAAAPPPVRSTGGGRKANPKVIAGVAGLIALAVIAAVIVIAVTGGNKSSPSTNVTTLPDAAATTRIFDGIPQHGNVLGSPSAPATLVEYIDLQCPVCRAFETEVMPTIIPKYVRTGKVKVVAKPLAFINPTQNSQRGRLAALAAGEQGRFFDFAQLMYANQGTEGTDWLTDDMVRSAYASIPQFDAKRALAARNSGTISSQASEFDRQAGADNVSGTPTILVGGRNGKLTEVTPGTPPSVGELEAALNGALRQ